MNARAAAERVFSLDVRSLALMRIVVAASVLVDLFTRLVHLRDHYSDDGVLPREMARSVSWLVDTSVLSISGSPVWAGAVFAVGVGLAIAVLLGWRTRLTTLALWLIVLAIQHRNPVLWDHRDALFSISLLYGALLPWGDAFSLDARRARGKAADVTSGDAKRGPYIGVSAAAYVLQIAVIYLFAALLKTGPEWRSDFTAVAHAISLEYWARPISQTLVEQSAITSVLTIVVLAFEFAVAPLLLCPWRTSIARWLVVGGLCALQLGFALFLWLDTFPLIAAAMTLGLLPCSLWSRRSRVPRSESPPRAESSPPRSELPRSESPPRAETSRHANVLAALLIGVTLALNLLSLDADTRSSVIRRPAELFGIDQAWTMFAPAPTRLDGWFVVEATRKAGPPIDLLTGRAVSWARPESFREGIRTTRELVYTRRLLAFEEVRESFAIARCKSELAPMRVAVYFIGVVEGEQRAPERLVTHDCR